MKQILKHWGSITWAIMIVISIAAQYDHLMSVLINAIYLPHISVAVFILMLFHEKVLTKRNAFDMMYTRLNKNKQPKQKINEGNHCEKTHTQQKNKQENQLIQANGA